MGSSKDFVEYILSDILDSGIITYKKMFGEYAIYYRHKVVALISDNQLFIKITESGKQFLNQTYKEGFPYPGAKACFLIEENSEDSDFLLKMFEVTFNELPEPKKKKAKVLSKN